MARKRGLFSTGTASAAGAGLGGVFGGINAAETINNNRAAREEARRKGEIDRFLAGVKLEELGRPTSVVTFGPDGKPQINIQRGASPERLDVLGGIIGLPGQAGGAAAPSTPRVVPTTRPPAPMESSAQKTARDLLNTTFAGQVRLEDVDEQTARAAVEAGKIVGTPVTMETVGKKGGFLGIGGAPTFRISMSGPSVPAPAPSSPTSPPAAKSVPGGKIRVSNGREVLLIDPADEADAAADGYRRI